MSQYGLNFIFTWRYLNTVYLGLHCNSLSLPCQQETGSSCVNRRPGPVEIISTAEASLVGEDNGEEKPLKYDHFTLGFGHGGICASRTWQALRPCKSRLAASDCKLCFLGSGGF